jgi:hypothetical protein
MKLPKTILCLFLVCYCAVQGADTVYPVQSRVNEIYDSLANPSLEGRIAPVTGIAIDRGGQQITLIKGAIRLLHPVNGRTFGMVFSGKGTFTARPLVEAERKEYERQTNKKLVNGEYTYSFQRAVFWFTDSTLSEMQGRLHFEESSAKKEEETAVKRSVQYITDRANKNSLYRIMQEMFEAQPASYLLYHFLLDRDGNDIFLEVDDREYEEVRISQPTIGSTQSYAFWTSPVTAFHMPKEYAENSEMDLVQEDKRRLEAAGYDISMEVHGGRRDISAKTAIHLRSLGESVSCTSFYLDRLLEISAITGSDGKPLSYLRGKDSWYTFVFLPAFDTSGITVNIEYKGDFLFPGKFYRLHSSTGWYPMLSDPCRSMFNVTYRNIPDDLTLVSAGVKELDTLIDGKRTLRYTTAEPTLIFSFSFGDFKETSVQLSDSETTVRVYDIAGGEPEIVGRDVANSIRLFSHTIGPFPYNPLNVTSGPSIDGQAFPGLIHIPWIEESVGEKKNIAFLARAHEVAHAYWGHGVGWQSYHDQWLSEGLAEYYSLMYANFLLRNNDLMVKKLDDWRDKLMETRKYSFGNGPALGSCWLTYRPSSMETWWDYTLVAYPKGAWIIHMLRMMMMDLQTFKEDAFKSLMADFYRSFKGRDASTMDFIHLSEGYFRANMKWFFDEWIYSWDIPVYKYSNTFSKTADGKWNLKFTVTQSEVPDTFKMIMPFQIVLKDSSTLYGRVMINKARNEFTYDLDGEPISFMLNPFDAVLCKIEKGSE